MRFLRFVSTDIFVSTEISVRIVISRLTELHVAVLMIIRLLFEPCFQVKEDSCV